MNYKFIPVNNDLNKAKAFANSLDQNFIINTQRIKQKPHYIPTMEVIETLHKEGWEVKGVSEERQRSTRKIINHFINLQHPDLKMKTQNGNTEAISAITISNSCKGDKPLDVNFGIFRLICSNGAISRERHGEPIIFKHDGKSVFDREIFMQNINNNSFQIMNNFEMLKTKNLTKDQMLELAKKAAKLKYIDIDEFDVSSLLTTHRDEDHGDDVWSVFNRIQENLTYDISSPSFDLSVNKRLTELVETYM